MAERTYRVSVKMFKEEVEDLREKAARSGLSQSAFLRRSVAEKEIKEGPPADVPMLIREVRRVGFYLEKIMKAAEGGGLPEEELKKALKMNRSLEQLISRSYGVPWQ